MINFFSKDLFVLIYYLIFLSVCGVLLFNSFKTEDKKKKNKKLIILVVIFITCNILPIYYIINLIPIAHNSIEDAFAFDNGFFKYKIIYKEEIKGKIYLIGKSVNSNDKALRFYCYEKNNNEFRLVNKNSDRSSNKKLLENYYIADYIDVKDKTAVFISKEGLNKDINKNTKITDKYGTKFSYVIDKNNKPIMYGESNNYVYFGLVNKPIDNDYYLLINNKKIHW
jgi:hypothetical protein